MWAASKMSCPGSATHVKSNGGVFTLAMSALASVVWYRADGY